MPCPHFSNVSGECVLQQDREQDDDEREPPVVENVSTDWCLSSNQGYRNCPLYQRFLAEIIP